MEANEKKAFVFDTNFIVQTKDLDEVMENLSDRFSVYVTQVSVDERIAQECREVKTRHNELERLKEQYAGIARISIIKTCEKEQETYRTGMQKKYEEAFKERLIPFSKDGNMLSAVLERAYNKRPPFLSDDKASDKGFKDALIWESILEYFKDKGEPEVLLITDDGGFTKNAAVLCAEFSEITGKILSIHPNSFYRELLKPELVEEPPLPRQVPNIEKLRERIQSMATDLCYVDSEEYWGNVSTNSTFFLNNPVDSDYVGTVFENLHKTRLDHLFESFIPASALLELDNRVTDTEYLVPMAAVDNAEKLYNEIVEQCPEYIEQFFSATACVINQNYREQGQSNSFSELFDADGELPF